jgi:hypothetical protein
MSFDLAVWRPMERQISGAEASRHYVEICSRPFDSIIPGPEMSAFAKAVVEQFRVVSSAIDLPWATEPDIFEDSVVMPIQSALAGDLFSIIRQLAAERGLVCFDPQRGMVYHPVVDRGAGRIAILELANGSKIATPDQVQVENGVRSLSAEDWFVILEREQNYYIQAAYGVEGGAPAGQFVIEYRNGSPDKHRRAFSSSVDDLSAAFLEYWRGGMDWAGKFTWVDLGL